MNTSKAFLLILLVLTFSTSDAQDFFYGRIMKDGVELFDQAIMSNLNKLDLDQYRFMDEHRNVVIENEKGEKLYDLILTPAAELKAEFNKPIHPETIKENKDSRLLKIVLNNKGEMALVVK